MPIMKFVFPRDALDALAVQVRKKRLLQNKSRRSLAEKTGVSESTLKVFEREGKISLESFIKVLDGLGCLNNMDPERLLPLADEPIDIKAFLAPSRQRGRE